MPTPTLPVSVPAMSPELLNFAKSVFPVLDGLFPTWEPALVALIKASTLPGAPLIGTAADFFLKAIRSVLVAQLGIAPAGSPTGVAPATSLPADLASEIATAIKQALAAKFPGA